MAETTKEKQKEAIADAHYSSVMVVALGMSFLSGCCGSSCGGRESLAARRDRPRCTLDADCGCATFLGVLGR